MDRQLIQLTIILLFNSLIIASGSYEVLNLSQDARSLALNNTTSAYDGQFMYNNPAAVSMRSGGMGYSYHYLPAKIHFGEIHHIIQFKSKGIRRERECNCSICHCSGAYRNI